MIRYALKCTEGHRFESWFQSADAFDALSAKAMVTCVVCGGSDVAKALMAPRVAADPVTEPAPPVATPPAPLSAPSSPAEQAMKALRTHVEDNATYVGGDFAKFAREMHLGDRDEAFIHGEANAKDAKALIEDGVPILPLPGPSRKQTN